MPQSNRSRMLGTVLFLTAMIGSNSAIAQTLDQRFQNWTYSCNQGACQTFVTLADSVNKEVKFSMSTVYNQKNKAVSIIVQMPLGVALPPGLRIFSDKTTHLDLPYQTCDKSGCSAAAVLDSVSLEKFKTAESLQVQFIKYGKTAQDGFKIPMAGFSEALAKLIAEAK